MKTIIQPFSKLLLVICSLFWLSAAQAQLTGNWIILHDAVAAPLTEVIVYMEVQNEDQFNGFQFDIPLPEGFSYVPGSATLNPERITTHTIQAQVLPGTSILRVISFSLYSHPFLGNEGILASFAFATPVQTGTYQFNPENGIMGPYYRYNILSGIVNGTVTITQNGLLVPGDANCDGIVNVQDIVTIASYILGNTPQPFCFENADVNGDGIVNVADVVLTTGIILNEFTCGTSTITDFDGNVYNTVQIGE